MNFEPCPMCGASLSEKNICFFDDDGCVYDSISKLHAGKVGVFCKCGYSYSVEVELLYIQEGGWKKNFVRLANRRYEEKRE